MVVIWKYKRELWNFSFMFIFIYMKQELLFNFSNETLEQSLFYFLCKLLLIIYIKQTKTMQLGSDFYFTSWLLYMFRALLPPIIRSMTTVYAAPGTSYTSDKHLPTWQGVHSLPRASCTHHQEYDNCICSPWYELHIGQTPSYVAGSSLPAT